MRRGLAFRVVNDDEAAIKAEDSACDRRGAAEIEFEFHDRECTVELLFIFMIRKVTAMVDITTIRLRQWLQLLVFVFRIRAVGAVAVAISIAIVLSTDPLAPVKVPEV